MKRFATFLGVAAIAAAFLPALAQAQVIVVEPSRVYSSPVIVSQPVVRSYYAPRTSYYAAPVVAYSSPPVVTYSAPAPLVTYSAPVVTYSAPATVLAPAGVYETRSYYGFGILRPRGWYTESYYRP
jgi:hypothetical protein